MPTKKSQARSADANDKALRATVLKIVRNWSDLKIEANDPYYTHDADAVFFDVLPLKFVNWQDYKDGINKLIQDFSGQKIEPREVRTHRAGRFAWATFLWNTTVYFKDGRQVELNGRSTQILEKRQGKWIVIHEHWSVPATL